MTDTTEASDASAETKSGQQDLGLIGKFLKGTEIDTRLLGMFGALALIWFGFHIYGAVFNGFGAMLTPRNLWNLSVQTSSIGIMATGMVLVIVTRHIDLSVGALLGVTGMTMGIVQVEILPQYLGLGHPLIWIVTATIGILMGMTIGAFHGWLIAYRGIPAFIVTLGGLLVWRGAAFLANNGKTISPVDSTFQLLGGGPYGTIGATGSWVVGIIVCIAIVWMMVSSRRSRQRHGFAQRPIWGELTVGGTSCALVIGSVLLVNSYPWPRGIVNQYAAANNITVPPEGLFISHGFAIPVLILVVVGILMTILVKRTRFGRNVFAIGGNPEAAELAGINVKWMTMRIFMLMGSLAGLAAVVASARLNSATNALGLLDELYVIAAAVIGGTSLAGGIGTIYGAILGALVMQSLQSGMVLIGFDTSVQQIVVGSVLVLAVYLDNLYRKNVK
ncbi:MULTISPECIES: sugar ABC transporter permease [Yoonia]|jgi:D-xylose transport system permease protein|uniref:Xylose transport system permease protein XylH n=1 Tax=Yoonia vestfoldensis SKA53 TaxID=314232 RepID=A3V823_9RHOB|nr:sugar ABC transporter permease [Yoonia vestfoldensis]EAQ05823.1 xylose transport permease protein xylH [Yoonia vestfoldensis SKA53]